MDRPVDRVDVRHLGTVTCRLFCVWTVLFFVAIICCHLMLFHLLVYTVTCVLLVDIIILKLLNNIFGRVKQDSRRITKQRDEFSSSLFCFPSWLHMSSFQCVGSTGFSFFRSVRFPYLFYTTECKVSWQHLTLVGKLHGCNRMDRMDPLKFFSVSQDLSPTLYQVPLYALAVCIEPCTIRI